MNQIVNIKLLYHEFMRLDSLLFVFNVADCKQNRSATIQDCQLSLSLLMDSRVVAHFLLIAETINSVNEFLPTSQEDLVLNARAINELNECIH